MSVAILIFVVAMLLIAASDRLAEHTGVVAPVALLALGIIVGFTPWVPDISVDPQMIVAVILPPLLYATATSMPTMDFRRNLTPIAVLSVLLVAVSAVVLGFIFEKMVPGIGLAVGIALGAVASPTDAVATSIVRRQGVSNRLVTVLEGEGLINDASALVIMSSALAAVAAHVTAGEVIGHFAQEVIVALLIGWLAGEVMVWVRARVGSVTADTVLSLVTPFVAYLPANALHGSGLVAAVIAGLVVGREAPERLHSSHRVAAGQMWATLQLVLESTVFGLMGIQLPGILHDVARGELHFKLAAIVAGVGLVATIVVRAVMVVPLVLGSSRRNNRREQKRPRLEMMNEMAGKMTEKVKDGPTTVSRGGRSMTITPERASTFRHRVWRALADIDYFTEQSFGPREGAVIVWSGMRGAVTLAAAQMLPESTPHRSFLILVAALLASASLAIQGSTLSLLVRLVKPTKTRPVTRAELRDIYGRMREAAQDVPVPPKLMAMLNAQGEDDSEVAGDIRGPAVSLAWNLTSRMRESGVTLTQAQRNQVSALSFRYALDVIAAQRKALLAVRDTGKFRPQALDDVFATLDADEMALELHAGPLLTQGIEEPGAPADQDPDDRLAPLE
ncbi:cation:proton antiporter [Propionibacterium freudenreichii]|uniref:cation:proton antiporter n=1 Tax=Propionibacterium freudenreichii TaxID=1744 RepID=UPI0007AC4AB0|nr:sodium:proton antiporter [Propionibacterium freudenreichii]CUW21190.1 Putative monovalent cation/proton antiporter [Propionibacterium freudenreichii subsp. shermanii]SPB30329.1 Sodium, potassium, lithium and rubidium/H(+) antiporter [Propionibacterium freudenreichii subsp. shermanii]SPS08443.1 Sodium, potassium, lithium and rubidium/H(+) antiporter [Propionibacterium freudenreichii subsp. shermanii]